jgi:DNA-binding NarL/FixJ family response regulator
MVLNGYKLMLDVEPDLCVTAMTSTAAEALAAVERELPDLVVTDLTMVGRGGMDLIKDLLALYPTLRVLVCSMHDETLYAERALRAGAKGYIMKSADGPTFLAAIRRVLAGQVFISPELQDRVCSRQSMRMSTAVTLLVRAFGRLQEGQAVRQEEVQRRAKALIAKKQCRKGSGRWATRGDVPVARGSSWRLEGLLGVQAVDRAAAAAAQ